VSFDNKHMYVPATVLIAVLFAIGALMAQSGGGNGDRAGKSGVDSGPAPGSLTVPKSPAELLTAAALVNGLDAPGLKPWHIAVTYDQFDEDGDNVDSGTYEEFWITSRQYRLAYASQDFKQTEYATESGLYRAGDPKWPGIVPTRVRDEFIRPMFRELNLQFAKPEKRTLDFGKAHLPCVMLRATNAGNAIFMMRRPDSGNMTASDGAAGFCFERDSLMLRYSKGGSAPGTVWDEIMYREIVQFQGRYIAREVEVTRSGKPYLKLHLNKLESLAQPYPADLAPPPNAVRIDDKPIAPDARVLNLDYLVHQEFPQYPRSIRPPGGEAEMKFKIDKEGRVEEVQFVQGNSDMGKTLEETLKKFVYRPFLLRGEPVEVETTQKFGYQVR